MEYPGRDRGGFSAPVVAERIRGTELGRNKYWDPEEWESLWPYSEKNRFSEDPNGSTLCISYQWEKGQTVWRKSGSSAGVHALLSARSGTASVRDGGKCKYEYASHLGGRNSVTGWILRWMRQKGNPHLAGIFSGTWRLSWQWKNKGFLQKGSRISSETVKTSPFTAFVVRGKWNLNGGWISGRLSLWKRNLSGRFSGNCGTPWQKQILSSQFPIWGRVGQWPERGRFTYLWLCMGISL